MYKRAVQAPALPDVYIRRCGVFFASPSGLPNFPAAFYLSLSLCFDPHTYSPTVGEFAQWPPIGGVDTEAVAVVTVKTLPITPPPPRETNARYRCRTIDSVRNS